MLKKHIVIMLLCCLIPIAALGALFLFQVQVTPNIWFGIMLLCPVLHLLMMKFMHTGEEQHHHRSPQIPTEQYGSKIKD
jgi:hypothetical protein